MAPPGAVLFCEVYLREVFRTAAALIVRSNGVKRPVCW